jgi:hypothetical protein
MTIESQRWIYSTKGELRCQEGEEIWRIGYVLSATQQRPGDLACCVLLKPGVSAGDSVVTAIQ